MDRKRLFSVVLGLDSLIRQKRRSFFLLSYSVSVLTLFLWE